MFYKRFLTLLLCVLCLNAYPENVNSLVSLARSRPTNTNIIKAYNYIIEGRCFERSSGKVSFEKVNQSLNNDEIAIEIFALSRANNQIEYIAFTVRNHYNVPHLIPLFKEQELVREMDKGVSIFHDTNIAYLLLNPLKDELVDVKKIHLTPAGKLHHFAFEYCNSGDGKMLAEKYQINRLTSSSIVTKRKDKRNQYDTYAIYGGIDFFALPDFEEKYLGKPRKSPFGLLDDSYRAAVDIHDYLKKQGLSGNLYENDKALEKTFKGMSKQGVPLLLIETHLRKGSKVNYPDALMFAGSSYVIEGGIVPAGYEDGLLTMEEIATMESSGIDLAIISACKSALGEIDWKGVNGLMRSFKTAGVNSLVMTTDDVVDYVSGEVWKSFFRNLIQGKSKRESLLEAIKYVRTINNGFYADPKYWTPFILIDGLD